MAQAFKQKQRCLSTFLPTALRTDGFEITHRSSHFAATRARRSSRASPFPVKPSILRLSPQYSALQKNAAQLFHSVASQWLPNFSTHRRALPHSPPAPEAQSSPPATNPESYRCRV